MAKDELMINNGIVDFDEFLKSKGISLDDVRVPLLKEFWNQGAESAINYVAAVDDCEFGARKVMVS